MKAETTGIYIVFYRETVIFMAALISYYAS